MTKTGDPLSAKEHRRVGAYAFNFTWSLLDKKRRTPEEDDEMLNASHASRFHWGRGGGPRNRSIGEWQVSRVYAVLGRAEPSAFHGGRALAIARRNHLSPFYVAYGHEALARAAGVAGQAKERDRHLRAAERAGRAIRDPDEQRMLRDDLATVRKRTGKMAASSTARRPRPKLIVLAGLPGTGKSTLAREFVERSGAVWLRVDLIEAAVLASGIPRSFETGLAAYAVARDVARDHLRLGRAVVIDAVNGVEPARTMWRELARECDADRYVVELRCSDPVEHRRRVETRGQPTPPLPAPSWEEVVGREYVPWTEPVLALESEDPPERLVLRILEFVAREPPRP